MVLLKLLIDLDYIRLAVFGKLLPIGNNAKTIDNQSLFFIVHFGLIEIIIKQI
jgi:hypothetical protein